MKKIEVNLSEADEKKIEELIKTENRWNILRRLKAIWGRAMKQKSKDLAKKLDVNEHTISNWVKIYNEKGLEYLCEPRYSERRKSRLEEIKDDIIAKVNIDTVDTLSSLSNWIGEEYAFYPEVTWLGRWCKKNGIFLTKKGS